MHCHKLQDTGDNVLGRGLQAHSKSQYTSSHTPRRVYNGCLTCLTATSSDREARAQLLTGQGPVMAMVMPWS